MSAIAAASATTTLISISSQHCKTKNEVYNLSKRDSLSQQNNGQIESRSKQVNKEDINLTRQRAHS